MNSTLPADAVKKVTNLVRDSQHAIVVAMIPVIGLIYILRLVQWYLWRKQFPILTTTDAGEHQNLANAFRTAMPRLWFAVLLWPAMFLALIVYDALN